VRTIEVINRISQVDVSVRGVITEGFERRRRFGDDEVAIISK